jgi:putative nucleotidyltransferase with HDIG domain
MNHIIKILQKLNHDTTAEVYYVGGFVRDLVRRKKPNNIDIVIRNYPTKKLIAYLKKHGTITGCTTGHYSMLFICDGEEVRISLPKNGKKAGPFFSLKEDAKARDLTINAMYLSIDKRSKKHIIDFFGGLKDIKNRKLRAVGNATRSLRTDPIRMLRAISFASWLNYKIDANLFYAIKNSADRFEKVPAEKIRIEFVKILLSKKPSKYLRMLHDTGLLYTIMPELHMCYGVSQNKKYHKHDVFTHSILACDNTPPDLIIRLSALLHDIGKLQTREEDPKTGKITFYSHEVVSARLVKRILRRLNFDREIVNAVSELVYHHMYNYEPEKWTDSAVRRFIRKAKIEAQDLPNLDDFPLFMVRRADRLANGRPHKEISYRQKLFQKKIIEIFEESNVITISDLDINGKDLMKEFNLREGPTVGHVLNYLLSRVLDDQKLNSKEILIEEAANYLSEALK